MRWRTEYSAGKGYLQTSFAFFTLHKDIVMNMTLSLAPLGIVARRRAYSDRAPAAELYRRGIPDRLRVAGTVRRYTPEINRIQARRTCSSKSARIDRAGRRRCSPPIFEILS